MALSPGSPQFPHDPSGPAATFTFAVLRLASTGEAGLAELLVGAHHVLIRRSEGNAAKLYEVQLTLHDAELEQAAQGREAITEALEVVSGTGWTVDLRPVPQELRDVRRDLNTHLQERGLPEVVDVRYRDRPGGGSHHVAVHRSTTDWDAIREIDEALFEIGQRQTSWIQIHALADLAMPSVRNGGSSDDVKPLVFVSYSTADEQYLKELMAHLAPIRRQMADVWTFRQIDAGDDHHDVIADRLGKASFGILLISSNFLASDYVATVELPQLTEGGKRLFAVIVGECDHAYLTRHLFAPWGLDPLNAMSSPERDRIYTQVAVAMRQALSSDS